jgi:hypothetical protein
VERSAVFYALTYLVMFAIPMFGLRGAGVTAPFWLKAAALSGFLMTLLYVVLALVPIIEVESRLVFALKMASLIIGTNAVGAAIFVAKRRSH